MVNIWYLEILRIIDGNKRYVRIYHIVDVHNNSRNGQYPEYMMKVQSKQGFCLFLDDDERDYSNSVLSVVYYVKNTDGVWDSITVLSNNLNNYCFGADRRLLYKKPVDKLVDENKTEQEKSLLTRELKKNDWWLNKKSKIYKRKKMVKK